jgi:hypothetical protein
MTDYFVFGGRLRSELEFPDLSPVGPGTSPDWEFRIDPSSPPEPIELLGTREIAPEWAYRLYRVAIGRCLEYGGMGSFEISSDGRKIAWHPGKKPEDERIRSEMARAIVLGPVMSLILQQSGILCLHGSAVAIRGEGVAFLAPKVHGKSTLALALTAAGAHLVTDDLVAIDPAPSPLLLPGVHSVRVKPDVAELLGAEFFAAKRNPGFKTTFSRLASESLAWKPVPLAAIYLLEPGPDLGAGVHATREALPAMRAAAALAKGKKLTDGLMGSASAGELLESIATVSSRVPVFRLRFRAGLERLPDVVGEILAWHASDEGDE